MIRSAEREDFELAMRELGSMLEDAGWTPDTLRGEVAGRHLETARRAFEDVERASQRLAADLIRAQREAEGIESEGGLI